MALSEFELIRQCFAQRFQQNRPGVVLGIGDDCALLDIPPGHHLAASIDTLVKGVHFPHDADAYLLGWRSLSVNLSDLAAMGAQPVAFTLALTLPEVDPEWLDAFSQGLADCAAKYDIQLVGGDTTKGPLSISIQVMGSVPKGQALTRGGAKVDDLVYVSGALGAAAAAVKPLVAGEDFPEAWKVAYYKPLAQIRLGIALRLTASACLDVSDGLLGDLQHILNASELGAVLDLKAVPIALCIQSQPQALNLALSGGDDYQLCFTLPANKQAEVEKLGRELQINLSCIGRLRAESGIFARQASGLVEIEPAGYQHF